MSFSAGIISRGFSHFFNPKAAGLVKYGGSYAGGIFVAPRPVHAMGASGGDRRGYRSAGLTPT
jgi:preprotein translocase subunit Sec61beta